MSTETAESALKSVKKLNNDVAAWEIRLNFLQNESESLKRKNEQVKKDIESALALAQQELDKKREQMRQETAKVNELMAKLESDKTEFQGILGQFNKEKRAFEADRQKMVDLNVDTLKLREKLSNFMVYLKREAAIL